VFKKIKHVKNVFYIYGLNMPSPSNIPIQNQLRQSMLVHTPQWTTTTTQSETKQEL